MREEQPALRRGPGRLRLELVVTAFRRAWLPAWTAAALFFCYLPILRGMVEQWWNDEDMGHGFLVAPAILLVVWRERGRWQAAPVRPNWWGLAILGAGGALHAAALLGAGLFAGALALLVSAAGAVAALGGFRRLRAWALPFALALFMLPKLAIVYDQATLRLQLLASRSAAAGLSAARVGVVREGNILEVRGRRVAVEEACSGIRYLLPLAFLAVLYGSLAGSRASGYAGRFSRPSYRWRLWPTPRGSRQAPSAPRWLPVLST